VAVLKKELQRKHRDRLQMYANQPHNLQLEQAKCHQEMQVHLTVECINMQLLMQFVE